MGNMNIHIVVFYLVVSLAVDKTTGITEEEERHVPVRCFKEESSCVYDLHETKERPGVMVKSCWMSCICSGFTTGVCEKSVQCSRTGKPWQCKCSGSTKLHIMDNLCAYHGWI